MTAGCGARQAEGDARPSPADIPDVLSMSICSFRAIRVKSIRHGSHGWTCGTGSGCPHDPVEVVPAPALAHEATGFVHALRAAAADAVARHELDLGAVAVGVMRL